MNKLYTYVVTSDNGQAPNPFWGWCTLAVCTPNHQGARAGIGDWIAGFLDKRHGHRFLYAMELNEERIEMDDYFNDPRFEPKKPRIHGTWRQRCGDNFYSRDPQGRWVQHENPFHNNKAHEEQDTKDSFVFVAKRFWYLGRKAVPLPDHLPLKVGGRGVRVDHPEDLVEKFKRWVRRTCQEGVTALPRDIEQSGCDAKPDICDSECSLPRSNSSARSHKVRS